MAIDVNFNNEEAINTKLKDLNYIPTYKEYEKERQENEIERQEYYEDFKARVENGEFNGEDACIDITTDTNIYDLDTGIYCVAEGVNLTYTEVYANDNPPILISAKSILKVVKKVVSEKEAYVYYILTTLNPAIDPTHESPIGIYQGSISLLDFFTIRWYGKTPVFISEKAFNNLINGSIKFIVVNELPTTNIDEKAIYMTPNINGITWDGNVTDKETFTENGLSYYKVSNDMLSVNDIVGKTMTVYSSDGSGEDYVITPNDCINLGQRIMVMYAGEMPAIMVVAETTTQTPYPTGVYFFKMEMGSNIAYISSLTLGEESKNHFNEYIYVNNNWEPLGSIEADFTNYINKIKTTNISSSSTDDEIPTAKAVYELVSSMINK